MCVVVYCSAAMCVVVCCSAAVCVVVCCSAVVCVGVFSVHLVCNESYKALCSFGVYGACRFNGVTV